MKNQTTLIIGANSGIARALAIQIATQEKNTQLIVISRNSDFYQQKIFNDSAVFTVADYQEETIKKVIQQVWEVSRTHIAQVFICHGVLHTDRIKPEKKLQDFSAENLSELMLSNAITPLLWLKRLTPMLSGNNPCKVVFFSARVGSISDNRLGGWYSYRASKAALNMLIKSTSIELARSAKNIKLISFHPGTTDTPLSKPFQKNVPEDKLFSSDFVATQLQKIVINSDIDGQASFIDWQGEAIPW
ncbi:short-chain dehydrogenase [Psychromonas marina]|uniref:Short-chain dehydrogenase n=1 Tax=Psychromonas marina TaxID=88364 RepID=A0ABQ6DVY6_9GAMM|nr:SDR family NAD(P)-dependent oxidoreductase [Psychromonas marina]GLS89183.1 short-chain dehydrogenase [Psychromonas marina]